MDDLTGWLMDSPTPSIRYLTLLRLLERSEADADVQAARQAMYRSGAIPTIFEQQTPAGFWRGAPGFYARKYNGTHWSMILLTELAADPDDPRMQRGVDYMLEATAHNHMLEGQFDQSVPSPDQFGFTCLWGNILRYSAYCGRADDPRVLRMAEYMARNLEGGGCRCVFNDYLPCAWGAARSLWGLAALSNRSATVSDAIDKTLDFLVGSEYQLAVGDYPTPGKIHKLWSKLSFPLFYQADVLFTLRILGELGALGRPGAQRALRAGTPQQQANGRWRGTNPYGSRTWKLSTDLQDTSRWVSLHAALVLKQAEAKRIAA